MSYLQRKNAADNEYELDQFSDELDKQLADTNDLNSQSKLNECPTRGDV